MSVAMSGVLGDRDRLDVVIARPQPSINTWKAQAFVPFSVIATTTFHGLDNLTVVEGTVKRSDDAIVKHTQACSDWSRTPSTERTGVNYSQGTSPSPSTQV